MGRKSFLIIGTIFVVLFIFGFVEIYLFLNSTPTQEKIEQVIEIPPGTPFRRIAKNLKLKGIITHEIKFYLLSRWKGNLTKIKAGEYLLYTNMKPLEVLDTLVSGRTYLYRVTIPEGYNLYQVADVVASLMLVSREEFLTKAYDLIFLNELGISGASVEGFLFPETYFFSKPITADKIIKTMVFKFFENYSEDIRFQAQKFNFSQHQIVTLASLIEKETAVPEERRLISAVFHNRLRQGMKLQSDPTVIYGIKNFTGNLTKKDLLTPTPYNTYTHLGLPFGPIANPSRASLEAAVNPAPVDYLFFVSKNDGSHFFSNNYRDHVNAVNRYQKK
ncbi:MAG: hypothetical protein A2Z91_06745 [Deltaproteobacteria bacterium GWA2_38_16]|nr:MAG: hypothetical protein A2Z91_06745 [Deltaproteobacteria bacterium GWA2_38_16]OGQ03393.1 MAG: hypothetical protein A3D19_04665 [Deltaproteobacteria bacterium RIFCSPHIGHO2_02_FULL_38_15]HBQ20670.1 endolytic transglycosylase MltG [Deltaproteobacteria bacterium]